MIETLSFSREAGFFSIEEAESIGWQPLGDGAYLHLGKPEALVITVVSQKGSDPFACRPLFGFAVHG